MKEWVGREEEEKKTGRWVREREEGNETGERMWLASDGKAV